jgi:hypothetical protein
MFESRSLVAAYFLPNRPDYFVGFRAKIGIVSILKILLDRVTEASALPVVHWFSGGDQYSLDVIQNVTDAWVSVLFDRFQHPFLEDLPDPKPREPCPTRRNEVVSMLPQPNE